MHADTPNFAMHRETSDEICFETKRLLKTARSKDWLVRELWVT
jgi:hypothetical protein